MKTVKFPYKVLVTLVATLFSISCATEIDSDRSLFIEAKATEQKGNITPSETNNAMPDEKITLVDYFFDSDLTVLATAVKSEPIALTKKSEADPNIVNLGDLAAGTLYTFRVEKVLFDKSSLFSSTLSTSEKSLSSFEIFLKMGGDFNEFYHLKGKYIIFLEKIPDHQNLTETYELRADTVYYHAYQSERSLFHQEQGYHEPSKKGIIDVGDRKNSKLKEKIYSLSQSLSIQGNNAKKIQSLEKLADESTELKEIALYAIKRLKEIGSDK